MDKSRVLTLIGVSYQPDSIGQLVPQETRRNVFCNISSVSASEWFEAGRAGLNAEHRATMFAYDYAGETLAELNGVRYGIYRTYLGKNETIELYLERKAGV
nr:MAG TPA: head closure knob [Caudoviricetes sp.]